MKSKVIYTILCAFALLCAAISVHAAIQQNTKESVVLHDFVPCAAGGAGEEIYVRGVTHTLITYTVNGNKVSGLFSSSWDGSSGYGLTTGDVYHATGKIAGNLSFSLQNGQGGQTLVGTIHLTGRGPGNNADLHENAHIMVNADGTVTTSIDHVKVTCQ